MINDFFHWVRNYGHCCEVQESRVMIRLSWAAGGSDAGGTARIVQGILGVLHTSGLEEVVGHLNSVSLTGGSWGRPSLWCWNWVSRSVLSAMASYHEGLRKSMAGSGFWVQGYCGGSVQPRQWADTERGPSPPRDMHVFPSLHSLILSTFSVPALTRDWATPHVFQELESTPYHSLKRYVFSSPFCWVLCPVRDRSVAGSSESKCCVNYASRNPVPRERGAMTGAVSITQYYYVSGFLL